MMRICLRVFLLLSLCPTAQAQEADIPAVVKRAIDAAGGKDLLTKFPAARLAAAGVLFADGGEIPLTAEQVYQVPGRLRTTVRLTVRGQPLDVRHVVNGAKAKYAINGSPVPVTEPAARELQAAMLSLEVAQLVPLLADRKFTVRRERMDRAVDAAVVGVQVLVKGGFEFHLGFDKATGHLTRLGRKAFDAATGKDVDQEQVFSAHKAFDGLTRPTKVVLFKNGLKSLELTTETFVPLEAVDAKEFATE